jgi:hypothetical protein
MSTPEIIIAALASLKEILQALHKDREAEFLKAWEKDEQDFLAAMVKGDVGALNRLVAKYRLGLF